VSAPPPPDRSIAETTALIGAGKLSAVELARTYLDRIDAFDPALNVYRTVTRELALEQAGAVDEAARAGRPLGPLAGVPVALKDNIAVSGFEMTAGTRHRAGVVADEDAPVYERLRDAGAVLLGKLSMSEWAIGATNQNIHYGDVHNPWDPTRVSGGSSGGSGAAIGADLAAATLGTDTGGSVRIPAALNGCCGLRPTAGRVSNRGSIPVAWTFDTIGPLARRAEDVAAVLHVIAGYDHEDPVTVDTPVGDYAGGLRVGVRGMRVGVLRAWQDELDADLRARLEAAASQLESLGAELVEAELTGIDEAIEWTAELLLAEAASVHRERLRDCPEIFADDVLRRLRRGESISGAHYGRGREWQRAFRRRVLDALAGCDLLLVPSAARHAPTAAESEPLAMTGVLARYTGVWVLSRTPALSVPIGFVEDMPVAMQLVGHPFEEGLLLRAAAAYQSATDWHLRRPVGASWLGG
jgi:aspartyl-tRNA(Asn)/glutamyl-tRNA(Gln) amidotransferase subunit A